MEEVLPMVQVMEVTNLSMEALIMEDLDLFMEALDLFMEAQDLFMEAQDLIMDPKDLFMDPQDLIMDPQEATRLRNQVTHCPLFLNQVLVTTADSTALQTGIMKIQESIIVLTIIILIITILIIIILVVTDKDPDTDLIMFTMMKGIEGKFSDAKATQELRMSIHLSVTKTPKPLRILSNN